MLRRRKCAATATVLSSRYARAPPSHPAHPRAGHRPDTFRGSQRLTEQRTGTVFGEPQALLRQHKVDSAWVLLFNAGERNEGVCAQSPRLIHAHPPASQPGSQRALGWPGQVHTAGPREPRRELWHVRARVRAAGGGISIRDAAAGAARFLLRPLRLAPTGVSMPPAQAQGFDKSTATSWTANLLSEFCSTAGFKMGFVPDKALLVPPHKNVYVDHHELANPPQPDSVDASASAPDTVRATCLDCFLSVPPCRCRPLPHPWNWPRVTGGWLGLQRR